MIPSVMNKFIKANTIITKSFDCITPFYVPVRGHLGYLPAQGRLHPWDTEETRVQRQVYYKYIRLLHKDGLKRLVSINLF